MAYAQNPGGVPRWDLADRLRKALREATLSELDEAADKARGAAALNAKWQPLAQAIVGSRNELATGTPATATESLIRNCGMS